MNSFCLKQKKRSLFKKIVYSLFIVSLIFSSCSDLKLEDKDKQDQLNSTENTTQNEQQKSFTEEYVSTVEDFESNLIAKVEEDKEPYKYRIVFNWKKFKEPRLIRLKRGTQITETDQKMGYFVFSVAHDQQVNFEIDVLNENRRIEYTFNKSVEIPRDFVVEDDNFILNNAIQAKGVSYYKINRLYTNPNRPLIVDSNNADIEVNQLFADSNNESVIGNYLFNPDGDLVATENSNGRSGGKLNVRIKNLFGKVHFIMKGENGGKGLNGKPWEQRARNGANGRDGICMPFIVVDSNHTIQRPCDFLIEKIKKDKQIKTTIVNNSEKNEIRYQFQLSSKDQNLDQYQKEQKLFQLLNSKLDSEKSMPQICGPTCSCESGIDPQPGDGGAKGRTGEQGKIGGSSGSINITVDKITRDKPLNPDDHQLPEDFVKVSLIPGKKGLKGLGGPGQLGGIGGENSKGRCRSAGREHVEGPQGPKGDDGVDGIDGVKETKCISVPSEGINFCE